MVNKQFAPGLHSDLIRTIYANEVYYVQIMTRFIQFMYVYNGSAFNKQVTQVFVCTCIQSLGATFRSCSAGENELQETFEPVSLLHFDLTCGKLLPCCFGSGFACGLDKES